MTLRAEDWAGVLSLSDASLGRLERLSQLLQKWNPAINLVAASTLPDVWHRHIADSAQVFAFAPPGARTWLDLGSGGGFPGLVVAILAKERSPDLVVELVDSDQRKCVFLQTVAHALDLRVTVTRSRIEALSTRRADVISARALASMEQLLRFSLPHLAPEGTCLFLKGAAASAELKEASMKFRFDADVLRHSADSESVVVRIRNLANA